MATQLPEWFKVGARVFIGGNERLIYEIVSIDLEKGIWKGRDRSKEDSTWLLTKVAETWTLYEGLYAITFGPEYEYAVAYVNNGRSKPLVFYFAKEIIPLVVEHLKIKDYKIEPKKYYQYCMVLEGKIDAAMVDVDTLEKWNKIKNNKV